MEFKGKIGAERLKRFGRMFENFVDETAVFVSDSGFKVLTVDSAHVAMAEVLLPRRAFQEFKLEGEGKLLFRWDKILDSNFGKNGSNVEIQFKKDATVFSSEGNKFTIPNDLVGVAEPKVPKLEPKEYVRCTVIAGEFLDALRSANSIEGFVSLGGSENGVLLSTEKDDGEKKGKQSIRRVFGFEIEAVGKVRSLFSCDYLLGMFRALPHDSEVRMMLSTDYPLLMRFEDGMFLLAPRIESEDSPSETRKIIASDVPKASERPVRAEEFFS